MTKSVYVIILNWNGWQDTIECVESCRRLTYPNLHILLVDNGSIDGSEAILRERLPDIELIQTGANLGFAGGNNAGIRHALDQGAGYVWLLNNDTVVEPHALSELVRVAESDNRIGMVGSKIFYYGTSNVLWYAGAVLEPDNLHGMHHLGLKEEDRGQFDKVSETGFVTGCSLLATKGMIEETGLMDERFFLYFEDSDWNMRAKKRGWKLAYCPASVVYHKVSLSVGGAASPLMVYYYARNFLYFVKNNYPDSILLNFAVNFYEHVLVNVKKMRFACARMALHGILDYMRGKTGAYRV